MDVEGGNATLFVSPSGESLLMDTGNGGAAAARDADRIMAAVKDAGLTQIDHLITTHWHGDHFGAMAELAGRIPIRHFIDHGPERAIAAGIGRVPAEGLSGALYGKGTAHDREAGRSHSDRRPRLAHRDRRRAGDQDAAARRGQPEPYCAAFKPQDADPTENAQSVGSVITFGRFRAAHLGDLTWNKEFDLMCPANRIGTVDLFFVSHHGQPVSNAEVLVHAHPVARGDHEQRHAQGRPAGRDADHPLGAGLEDLWQVHFSR